MLHITSNSLYCMFSVTSFAYAQSRHTAFSASIATVTCLCRFMKLRLDRVMKLELGEMTPEKALDSGAPVPEFPPLDRTKWTAPYSPYKPGWWKAFEPDTFFKQ